MNYKTIFTQKRGLATQRLNKNLLKNELKFVKKGVYHPCISIKGAMVCVDTAFTNAA
jgi:hypothetical protein